MKTEELLRAVQAGDCSVEQAMEQLKTLPYENMGYARLDHHRALRTGFPEVIFSQGKTVSHMAEIFQHLYERSGTVLATRASREQYEAARALVPEAVYNEMARTVTVGMQPESERPGLIAVCTGGTADIPVAEEAAVTAEMCGAKVLRVFDIGVSGLHRLLSALPDIRHANAIVAVAGMEGALASVLAGQVDKPVIAVPTSVGYGANFGGLSALLTMVNSCAAGISVVNIDNGFGGGYQAAQINRLVTNAAKKEEHK